MHRFTGKTEQMAQKAAEQINPHNAATSIDYHMDGSSIYFLFYFRFDGSGRETKSLKVAHTTLLMYANYVTIMSQPP